LHHKYQMQRTPEPEIMHDAKQALAYSQYDRSKLQSLIKHMYTQLLPATAESIIDFGCGPGDITLTLAALTPNTPVVGIDASNEMLLLAHEINNVKFQQGIVGQTSFGNYSRVVSTMALHHFHDPKVFWNAVKEVNPLDVFVFDLVRPSNELELEEFIVKNEPYDNEVFKDDFENSLRAAFTYEEIEQQLIDCNLDLSVTRITRDTTNNFELVVISGEIHD
jgi:trans-aconitate methyltransferase